ncbi:MAG: TonB-dependent receptor [Solitalea sp.]
MRCISRWGSMLVVVFCALGVKAEPRAFYQRGKITVAVSNAPLKAVFDAIERQAKVRFMYDMMVVDDKQKVSIQAKEVSLEYILNQLLEGKPLKWSQEKRVIRIEPAPLGTQALPAHTPSAQDTLISVTGLVSDTAGAPLPGVSVLLKGMNRGTATDLEGRFSLENINPNGVLVLSFLGYRNLEIPLEGRTAIQAVMKADVAGLDEVVVVGYGTTRKSDLTGSVASIKGEDIAQNSMGSFESLLQGRVSGLQIMNRNNDNPQGGTTVRIRGVSSINGSNAPLVVVDGIPLGTAGGINAVNPAIISSIEVLKDASATAIYGSRGANGVIMITTKRGETGRASIWLNQKTNFTSFSDNLDYWRDVNKMVLLSDEGRENAGLDPLYIGQRDPSGTYYPSRADIQSGAWPYHTNWPDYVFRDVAITSDVSAGVQGGSDKSQYFVSLGHYQGQGMQREDDYNKTSLDLSYEHQIAHGLTVLTKSGIWRAKRNINYGMDYNRNPLYPVYNGDGTYYKLNPQDYGNPVAMTNERVNKAGNLDGYATLQFNWDIASPLQMVVRGNVRAGSGESNFFNPPVYTQGGDLYNGEGGRAASNYTNLTLDGYLTYTKNINPDHNLTAMVGANYENSTSKSLNTVGRGFPNDILKDENMAGAETQFISNARTETVLASGFARVNYSYKNRYLATFTARADGSSKFGDNNKWGFFPSGAVSWRLSEEEFLKDSRLVDHLKLRASWGISGNQGIAPYQTISQFGQDYYYLGDEEYIIYGVGREIGREGIGNRYVQWGGMANKNLRWEKTAQFDIGMDLSMLQNRLDVTFDYYYKRTSDLLRQQFLNPSTGFDRVWTNDGKIENRGIELAVDGRIVTQGKLRFDAGLIFNLNRNKVLDIGSQKSSGYLVDANGVRYEPYGEGILNDAYLNVLAIGHPINSFYGYEVNGIIQEMPENPTKNTRPGEFNYVGLNPDGTLDPDARVIIGDPNPDFTTSLNLRFYHQSGFDLSVLLYSVYGNDIFSLRKLESPSLQEGRWTAVNQNNKRPSLRADRQYFASSWFVEDGSFLRIQHVTLGYTLPELSFLTAGRVFLNAANPLTFSRTSEYDAEVGENGRGGTPYPRVMVLTAGLELKF